MFRKLADAIELLFGNFVLLSAVILTVSLPINVLINYFTYFVLAPEDFAAGLRVAMWVEGIFRPISIGAIIWVMWNIKQGKSVGYAEALGVGIANWGRLFVARFIAGLLIGLGMIAFIVPGVMLSLRWAVLDEVVILEQDGGGNARSRSSTLTQGVQLQILGLAILIFFGYMFLNAGIYIPIALLEEAMPVGLATVVAVESVVDSLLDIAFALLEIVTFLYYWDGRQRELGRDGLEREDEDFGDHPFLDGNQPAGEVHDDGNPYRPPLK